VEGDIPPLYSTKWGAKGIESQFVGALMQVAEGQGGTETCYIENFENTGRMTRKSKEKGNQENKFKR